MKKLLLVLIVFMLAGCSVAKYHPSDDAYLVFYDENLDEQDELTFEFDDILEVKGDTVHLKNENVTGKVDKKSCELGEDDFYTCLVEFDDIPLFFDDMYDYYEFDDAYVVYPKDASEYYFSFWYLDKEYDGYYSQVFLSFEKD